MIDLSGLGPIARELAVLFGLALAGFALWRNILAEIQRVRDFIKNRKQSKPTEQLLKPTADEIEKYKKQTFGQRYERFTQGNASKERGQSAAETLKSESVQSTSQETKANAAPRSVTVLVLVGRYFRIKIFKTLDAFVDVFIKWLIPAVAAYFLVRNSDTVSALINALSAWINVLPL